MQSGRSAARMAMDAKRDLGKMTRGGWVPGAGLGDAIGDDMV